MEQKLPDFSIVSIMIKELMGQYAGLIANEFSSEEKLCTLEKANEIAGHVATKFGATVVFSPKKIKTMCIKCDKTHVSKLSKSGKYCGKCAKEINDIADKMSCIAPGKNKKECGRVSYGIPYCSLHKKWGEAKARGKICVAKYTKGEQKNHVCNAIIKEDSNEQFCKKHSRVGKCKYSNAKGKLCRSKAEEGKEYCDKHLNAEQNEAHDSDEEAEEAEEVKHTGHSGHTHHKKVKVNDKKGKPKPDTDESSE
jgi:hypothetical protein